MKKILLKYLNLYVLSGLLLVGFAGCSDDKDNDPVNPGPDVEELPSIGTYSFRGEANRIVSGEATMDGGSSAARAASHCRSASAKPSSPSRWWP